MVQTAGMKPNGLTQWQIASISCLALIFYLAVAFGYGPISTPDGDVLLKLAMTLNQGPFGSEAFAKKLAEINSYHPIHQPIQLYRLYIYVLWAMHGLFGDAWHLAHLALNALAYAGVVWIFTYVTNRLCRWRPASVATALGLVACWEYVQWVAMTQSESLFLMMLAVSMLLLVLAFVASRTTTQMVLLGGAVLVGLFSIFFRPSGIPLTIFLALVLVAATGLHCFKKNRIDRPARAIGIVLIMGTPLGLLAGATILFDPSWLPEAFQHKFVEYTTLARDGVIVFSRPHTNISAGDDYLHFLYTVVVRFPYFFIFLDEEFSTPHNIINLAFYLPFYFLIGVSLVSTMASSKLSGGAWADVSVLFAGGVLVFAVFHSASLIDFDWRYRAPAQPMMAVIAAHGLYVSVSVLRRLQRSASA